MTQTRTLDLELAELKRQIVSMSDLVGQGLAIGIKAIMHPHVEAKSEAKLIEMRLDEMESVIEDHCHRVIALQAPRASDLRFLISAMRITADLEQVGDLAESVSKRATYIARNNAIENPPELSELTALTQNVLRNAMEAFISGSLDKAKQVFIEEKRSDELTKVCYRWLQSRMAERSDRVSELTHLLRAVGHLEHISDIAAAIAEESVYIHKAALIRHHHEDV